MEAILNHPGLVIVIMSWVICGLVAIFTKDTPVLFVPTFLSAIFLIARCMAETGR
jgi:hypothetical protein